MHYLLFPLYGPCHQLSQHINRGLTCRITDREQGGLFHRLHAATQIFMACYMSDIALQYLSKILQLFY